MAARWLIFVWVLILAAGCGPVKPQPGLRAAAAEQAAVPSPSPQVTAALPTLKPAPPTPTPIPQPSLTPTAALPTPASFAECAAGGGKVREFFPRTCLSAGGQAFVEPLPEGILFSRAITGLARVGISSAEPTSDGGALITGLANGTWGFVLKVGANGAKQWQDLVGLEIEPPHYGEHTFQCAWSRETTDGGFSVLCFIFHRMSTELYLIRYTPDGQRTTAEQIKPQPQKALALDENGGVEWINTFGMGASRVIRTADGGYAFVRVTSFGDPEDRTSLVKTDAQNHYAWDRLICDPSKSGSERNSSLVPCFRNNLHGVIATHDGGFAFSGSDYTDQGPYLLKVDALGKPEWLRYYPGGPNDIGWAVVQFADGGYLLTGSRQTVDQRSDAFLIRTAADGSVVWEKVLGGSDSDYFEKLVPLKGGGVLAVGNSLSLGTGERDLWLVGIEGE